MPTPCQAQTGDNEMGGAPTRHTCGHDPNGEHQMWLDAAAITPLASWPRCVPARTRDSEFEEEGGGGVWDRV